MAHRVLARRGLHEAAAAWRGRMREETRDTAADLVARLEKIEAFWGVRLASVGDMKVGSPLMRRLNADPRALAGLDCCSLYCLADLMVVPGWTAVLPVGRREVLRPLSLQHHELMAHPASVAQVAGELLRP
jgi:hypothetical protein